MNVFLYGLFTIVFLYVTNWFQVNYTIASVWRRKERISIIKDKWIQSVIEKKTGIKLKRIIIFESKKLFGMMPGIPIYPELILSRGLYKSLNKDELEWVVLHEVGHCKLWHVVKSGLLELLFLITGLWFVSVMDKNNAAFLFTLSLAIIMSFLCIQVLRYFEYEADKFSIERVDNPKGVISAQKKFLENWSKSNYWFHGENSIFRKLLYWNILPKERVRMARLRLELR